MVSDFDTQVPLLKNRFIEKGYNLAILDKEITQVRSLIRNSMLAVKIKPNETQKCKWSFITTSSRQHYQIKNIFKKHWSVLKKMIRFWVQYSQINQVLSLGDYPPYMQV